MDPPEKKRKKRKVKRRAFIGPIDTRTPLEKIPGDKSWTDRLPLTLWGKVFWHKKKAESKWIKDVGFVRLGGKVMCATPYGIPGTDTNTLRPSTAMTPEAMAKRLHAKFDKIFTDSKTLGHRGMAGVPLGAFTLGDQNGLKRRLKAYKSPRNGYYVLNLEAFDLKVDEGPGYAIRTHFGPDTGDPHRKRDAKLLDVCHSSPVSRDMLRHMKPWPKDERPPLFVIDLSPWQNFLQHEQSL